MSPVSVSSDEKLTNIEVLIVVSAAGVAVMLMCSPSKLIVTSEITKNVILTLSESPPEAVAPETLPSDSKPQFSVHVPRVILKSYEPAARLVNVIEPFSMTIALASQLPTSFSPVMKYGGNAAHASTASAAVGLYVRFSISPPSALTSTYSQPSPQQYLY